MKKLQFIFVALLLLSSSCATTRKVSQGDTLNLGATTWQVMELNGKSIEPSEGNFMLVLNIDNTLSGKGACNVIMGSYSQNNSGELSISKLASTRSMCPDMATEVEYIQALESASFFTVEDGDLVLLTGGKTTMRLKSVIADN
ncbi:MAG: META domain-containing protein [Rikenellaceae bacterium]